MKKVLFVAFAGFCVASSLMGTTAKVNTNHGVALNALDTVPKTDTPKFAQLLDTVPKTDTPKFAQFIDTVPKKDSPKVVRVVNYVMDTIPKTDSPKKVNYLAMN